MGKLTSLTAGIVVGTALGMMVVPNLDKRPQRTFKRVGRRVMNMAGEPMNWM